MSRLVPTIMYALAIIMILWLIVGAITLPNASQWFKGKSPSIQQDVVMLPSNKKNDTIVSGIHVQYVYGQWQYSKQLVVADNVPAPPAEGLQGILYDRGKSCEAHDPNALPSPLLTTLFPNVSKIALIQRGGCFFSQKLLNAQLDGASAAIIYNNISFDDDPDMERGMCIQPNTISIPAYYVDLSIGLEMYNRLKNLSQLVEDTRTQVDANSKVQENESNTLTRVTLYPAQKPRLDPWQFALIIIGVVIVTSLAIIANIKSYLVAMQCHLWRIGRQQRQHSHDDNDSLQDTLNDHDGIWHGVIGSGAVNSRGRKRHLTAEAVNALPTRIYGEKQHHPSTDDATLEIPHQQHHDMENNNEQLSEHELQREPTLNDENDSQITRRSFSISTVVSQQQHHLQEQVSCVICLDSFTCGDVLRILPCHHEYHRDCIDTWLTKKSSSCPLCLQAVRMPTEPPEAHMRRSSNHEQSFQTRPPVITTEDANGRVQEYIELEARNITLSHNEEPHIYNMRRLWCYGEPPVF
ncbi:hypothetical protein BDA99DRAFT_559648 [Phascolomyces articulosus]|uniref:RING-type domain-containing protein n=1 Tax=Phascolomyces articulosus TaxID=60185 RepID=A0AAD5KBD2_9FUNG|nr:hypothetical protein BDA99DRAFT_559648 [Phascolomyces articulosus]